MATIAKLAIGIGGMILSAVLAPKPKDQYGPRLSDINIASVSPGNPIIRHWGTMKLPGQIIWTSKIIETEHVEEIGGGKKGGGGKKSAKAYTYTYSVDAAIAVCAGPVHRIRRIWANHKLLWIHPDVRSQQQQAFDDAYYAELDRLVNQEGLTYYEEAYCGAFFFAFNNFRPDEYTYSTEDEAVNYIMGHPGTNLTPPVPAPDRARVEALVDQMLDGLGRDQEYATNKIRFDAMNIYLGSEEQLPNAKMESYMGAGNVPGYRGTCYFVMHNLQLEDFGNAIPQFNIEVEKTDHTAYLHEIIYDVCRESGLDYTEFDGLGHIPTNIEIPGYAVTQNSSGRQVLNQLQSVFPFEGAENAYRLVFAWVNERPKAILRREDFGAHIAGDEAPTSVESSRSFDFDLPRRINLKFQEPVRSYSPNQVFAQRTQTQSSTVDDVDLTIALTRAMAKKQVEEMLAMKFTARKAHKVTLPRKYVVIEPGDGVLVPDEGDTSGYRFTAWRCIQVDIGANDLCEFTFTEHNYHPQPGAITEPDIVTDPDDEDDMPQTSPTFAYMLDMPLISDTEEDNIGYYSVLSGSNNGWTGGVLILDVSSGGVTEVFGVEYPNEPAGASWYIVQQTTTLTAHGFCMTPLAAGIAPGTWDYVSVVRVYMYNKGIDLANAAKDDMYAQPLNAAVIGDEYVQYARAVDKGNGIWELSEFLRGQRGTDYVMDNHVPGERFVRMRAGSIKRVKHSAATLNQPGTYRAVTFDADADTAPVFTFTNTGNSLRPYAPSIVEIVKRANNDVDIEWSPRPRQNGGLVNGQETVSDQPFDRYEIDVVNEAGTVVRTVALEDVRTWTYTAAMQTTDRGSALGLSRFRVYQVGNIIGRGFPTKVEA